MSSIEERVQQPVDERAPLSSERLEELLYEERPHPWRTEDLVLDHATVETLWGLFAYIGVFWDNLADSGPLRSQWLAFLENRILSNPSYAAEYRNGAELIRLLIADRGEEAAYTLIFTDPGANIAPPRTRLARLRQLISNEFITLQLSLGGFRSFGAKNYLGFFGGPNEKGRTPYRVYVEAE